MKFSKMHGLGNDFMIVDAVTQSVNISAILVKELSDRHYGIGFDQLLIVEPPHDPDVDFHYRIFNSDGGEVGQCGNGVRCFARFVYMKRLTSKRTICVSSKSRRMILSIMDNDCVRVNMGVPIFNPDEIPFYASKLQKTYIVTLGGEVIKFGAVSIGNPHCIVIVDEIKEAKVLTLGKLLEQHDMFPEMVNVGFMQIDTRQHIYLRVYERFVGETKACGSGACAAVAIGIIQGFLDREVYVDLPGGRLVICWEGDNYPLYMVGPAVHVYDGWISI